MVGTWTKAQPESSWWMSSLYIWKQILSRFFRACLVFENQRSRFFSISNPQDAPCRQHEFSACELFERLAECLLQWQVGSVSHPTKCHGDPKRSHWLIVEGWCSWHNRCKLCFFFLLIYRRNIFYYTFCLVYDGYGPCVVPCFHNSCGEQVLLPLWCLPFWVSLAAALDCRCLDFPRWVWQSALHA